jgi:hypothetical protein
VSIPTEQVARNMRVGSHEEYGPISRSRLAVTLLPSGEVEVRPVGKVHGRELRKFVGKHKVE